MKLDVTEVVVSTLVYQPGFLRAVLHREPAGQRLEVWVSVSLGRRVVDTPWFEPVKAWLTQTPHTLSWRERAPYQGETRGGFLGGHDYFVYLEV